jgi:hypothetical protein
MTWMRDASRVVPSEPTVPRATTMLPVAMLPHATVARRCVHVADLVEILHRQRGRVGGGDDPAAGAVVADTVVTEPVAGPECARATAAVVSDPISAIANAARKMRLPVVESIGNPPR